MKDITIEVPTENNLIVGKKYFQKHCRVWLTYKGNGYTIMDWLDFHKDGKLYNQLREDEIEGMFDFEKEFVNANT